MAKLPKALKVQTYHKSMTKKEWVKFMPIPKLVAHLRAVADSLEAATNVRADVRGKAHLTIEIGYPLTVAAMKVRRTRG